MKYGVTFSLSIIHEAVFRNLLLSECQKCVTACPALLRSHLHSRGQAVLRGTQERGEEGGGDRG